ncbi:MAG: hypothetical protein ACI8PZ_004667, partial [Myxococcota bacterium]
MPCARVAWYEARPFPGGDPMKTITIAGPGKNALGM